MGFFSLVAFFKQYNVYGFRCQCSGVSKKMTEDRKQRSDRVLHPPVFIIYLLSSDLCPLKPDT